MDWHHLWNYWCVVGGHAHTPKRIWIPVFYGLGNYLGAGRVDTTGLGTFDPADGFLGDQPIWGIPMATRLTPGNNLKLVVAISSRTLFDLDDSHAVFQKEGDQAYRK